MSKESAANTGLPLQLLLLLLVAAASAAASIPGPRDANARIGIVGAGPAGLHMAYLLRNLGFRQVRLLESGQRVGGRSVSVPGPAGIVHEMGTCYLTSDYTNVRKLAAWTGQPLREVQLPEASMTGSDRSETASRQFVQRRVCRLLRLDCRLAGTATQLVQRALLGAAGRYAQLHASLFRLADGFDADAEFPTRRPVAVGQSLNLSIAQFLQRHSLLALEPLFLLGMTTMGYGSLADTSIVYGLMWMTPAFLNDLLVSRSESQLSLLADGWEGLWQRVRDRLGADVPVQFQADIAKVQRGRDSVSVWLQDGSKQQFDWLIWTPNLALTHQLFADLDANERRIFEQLRPTQFVTKVLSFSAGVPMSAPVTYFDDNLLRLVPDPAAPWAARNSAKALGRRSGTNSSIVAYFLSDRYEPDGADSSSSSSLPAPWSGAEVQHSYKFSYMTKFSVAAMASGILWDIVELQGRRRVWFAGNSVVFDSVKSVVNYNKMLINLAFPHLKQRVAQL